MKKFLDVLPTLYAALVLGYVLVTPSVDLAEVLLLTVVLANAQVSRLLRTPEPPVVVAPPADPRVEKLVAEVDQLSTRVNGLSLSQGLKRRG